MKKIITTLVVIIIIHKAAFAQTYSPITTNTTGYNVDAIAENTPAVNFSTGALDQSDYIMYSAFYGTLFSPVGTGLPNNGTIVNGSNTYQLQPYNQKNVLHLLPGQKDSLEFTNPANYSSINLLSFGTEGNATIGVTIRFTDNSTEGFANNTVVDWFNGTGAVISGFDRTVRQSGVIAYVFPANPIMYAQTYTLNCANRVKQVKRVIISNSGASAHLCVTAVSGAPVLTYSANVTNIPCAITTSSATIITSGGLPPYSYTWGTSPVQTASTATGMASGSYTYSVGDGAGCIYSSTVIMPPSNGAQSPPTLLPFQNPICSGQQVIFNAIGAASYSWAGPITITNGVPFSPTAAVSPAVIDFTVTGANSCSTSTNASIISLTVNPSPTITATASSPTLCTGLSTTLTGGGSASGSYSWTGGVSNGVGFAPTTNATYTVSGASAFGCVSSANITLTVVVTPTAMPFLSPPAICIGNSSTVSAVASSHTWLPSGSNGSFIIVSPQSTTIYTITKANANCVDTKTFSIIVNPLPTVSISSSTTTVCAGRPATLIANTMSGSTYTWMPVISFNSLIAVSPMAPTVYTAVVNNGTCSTSGSISINTIPTPTIAASASATQVCAGSSVTLTAIGGNNYTWTPGGTNSSIVVITPSAPTLYSVTGNNAQGCLGGASQAIVVYPLPILNISASDAIVCNGGTSTLTVTGANTYTWGTSATSQTITVNPTQTTNYTVAGTSTSSGCSNTAAILVNVFSPSVTISGNSIVCSGKSVTLTAMGANSYTWNTGSVAQTVIQSPATSTVYSLSATTNSIITCVSSASISVTVNPNPTVTVASSRSVVCRNEKILLTASGAPSYTWNQSTATTNTISITPTVITTLLINVTGTSANGCSKTASTTVIVKSCTGINEVETDMRLAVYPNPFHDEIIITSDKALQLSIINCIGVQVAFIEHPGTGDYRASVQDLPAGVYFLRGLNNYVMFKKVFVKN